MTMALKPDQQHIKDLLTETITLLCCNGLHFKAEFSIDALIGITLDQNEVFLVSIKETFQNDKSGVSKKRFSQPEPNKPCLKSFSGRATPSQSVAIDECLEFKDDLHMGDGEDPEDCAVRDYSQQNYAKVPFCIGSPKQLSNKRKHRTPLKLANNDSDDCFAQEHSLDKPAGFKRRMLDTSTALEHTKGERSSEGVVDCHDNSFAKTDTQYENSSANNPAAFTDQEFVRCESNVNPGTCEKDEVFDDSDNELVFIKQEPVEKTLMPVGKGINSVNSRQYANDEFKHKPQHRLNFSSAVNSMQSVFLQLPDPAGCSSWNFPETSNSLQMPFSSRHRWQLAPVEPQLSEKETDRPPDMSTAEIGYVRDILSISGSFINIGSAKAFHRNLRQLSREDLSVLLTKMNSPMGSCYCVGVLCTDGVSRVFYKCPPELLRAEAIKFYDLSPDAYASIYNGQVKVSKRVLDPFDWVQRLSKCSPYASG